jgi:hypothetical protein
MASTQPTTTASISWPEPGSVYTPNLQTERQTDRTGSSSFIKQAYDYNYHDVAIEKITQVIGSRAATDPTGSILARLAGVEATGSNSFIGLTDTPAAFGGNASEILVVNASANAVAFKPIGDFNFTELGDTPASLSGQGSKIVQVNSGGTALEFVSPTGANFLALEDTPASYSGAAFAPVMVGENADSLVFDNDPPWIIPTGGTFLLGQGDRDIVVDAASLADIELPAPGGLPPKWCFKIKNLGGSPVQINAPGSSIDGAQSAEMNAKLQSMEICKKDNNSYRIASKNRPNCQVQQIAGGGTQNVADLTSFVDLLAHSSATTVQLPDPTLHENREVTIIYDGTGAGVAPVIDDDGGSGLNGNGVWSFAGGAVADQVVVVRSDGTIWRIVGERPGYTNAQTAGSVGTTGTPAGTYNGTDLGSFGTLGIGTWLLVGSGVVSGVTPNPTDVDIVWHDGSSKISGPVGTNFQHQGLAGTVPFEIPYSMTAVITFGAATTVGIRTSGTAAAGLTYTNFQATAIRLR